MPFFIFSLIFSSWFTNASPKISDLALSRGLDTHSRWLALGHFGEIRSDNFYLSPQGPSDPRAELLATIEAFYRPVEGDPNQHAQCRFPARLGWLKKELSWDGHDLPKVNCERYLQFSYQGQVESISLIFATGYLSNPASYFGHPLVKFNLPRAKIPNNLLDTSVNYGAMTPPNENPVVYALKGLFGGYDASFTHRQFFYSTHAYAELELRDLWEYRLRLTRFQIDQIVGHTWEILGRDFAYLFLSKNCASAMAKLLEDETGVELMPRWIPYSLPYTLFDRLAHQKDATGATLVESVTFIPSRQSRLTAGYRALSRDEQRVVRSVANTSALTPEYQALDPASRTKVTDTLFDYYSFRAMSDSEDEKIKSLRRELLTERLKLPPGTGAPRPVLASRPPHEGLKPFLTRIGYFDSVRMGEGFEFRTRTAHYDYLAPDVGRPANSNLRTWDIAVAYAEDKFWLKRFELVAVETLNISQTGLPGDGGIAWKFNLGFEAVNLACTECAAFKIEGGVGKAFKFLNRYTFFGMLDARAQSAAAGSGHLAATPHAGAILDVLPSGWWRVEANIGYRDYFDDVHDGEAIVRVENRFGSNREWDARLSYEKHVDEQMKVSYSRYW